MNAEKKQALIEYCERVLHGSNNNSQMEQVYKIALAALTAPPDDWKRRAEAAESNSTYNGGGARYWHDEYCAQQQRLVSKIASLEAKLAELAKQKPVHFRPFGSDGETYVKCSPDHIDAMAFWQHPTPAADLAELVPDGWKLVPGEPTKEMVAAGQDRFEECIDSGFDSCEDGSTYEYSKISSDAPYLVYIAMLAAAPEVE